VMMEIYTMVMDVQALAKLKGGIPVQIVQLQDQCAQSFVAMGLC
jgi:hypothetical protein